MIVNTKRMAVVAAAAGTLVLLVAMVTLLGGGGRVVANSPFPAVYSDSPVVGQYSYVIDSGTNVANGYAYSFVTLDLTKLPPGSQFTFLPGLNTNIGSGSTPPQILVTSTGHSSAPDELVLSWTVSVPFFNQTITLSSTLTNRMIPTGVASLGNNGVHIFIQPVWLNDQTVKVYFYVGPLGMPLAP